MPQDHVHTVDRSIHDENLVVDVCGTSNFSLPTPRVDGRDALDRAIEGGIDCAVVTTSAYDDSFMTFVSNAAALLNFIADQPDKLCHAESVAAIRSAKVDGKLSIVIGLQTATPVERDWLTTLCAAAKLGVRTMQLTYNEGNRLGSGCLELNDGGLTAYGRQVLDGMRRFGVIPDIAHAGERTARDILNASSIPVICSHGNAAAITKHPRNLSDDMIKRIARSGGVVGIAAWTPLNMRVHGRLPTIVDYLDHLEHVLEVAGPDGVALGLDLNENMQASPGRSNFDYIYDAHQPSSAGMPQSVRGLDNLAQTRDITEGMLARGISHETIKKILGENFLRVADQVWLST